MVRLLSRCRHVRAFERGTLASKPTTRKKPPEPQRLVTRAGTARIVSSVSAVRVPAQPAACRKPLDKLVSAKTQAAESSRTIVGLERPKARNLVDRELHVVWNAGRRLGPSWLVLGPALVPRQRCLRLPAGNPPGPLFTICRRAQTPSKRVAAPDQRVQGYTRRRHVHRLQQGDRDRWS